VSPTPLARQLGIKARLGSYLLIALSFLMPVTAFVAIKAEVTAVQAAKTAASSACHGSNEAKLAVSDLVHTLVANAERPIANATPD